MNIKQILSSKKNLIVTSGIVALAVLAVTWFALARKGQPSTPKAQTPAQAPASGGGGGGGGTARGLATPLAIPRAYQPVKPIGSAGSGSAPAARIVPSSIPDPSVVRIQQQINEIIRLNETLKARNQSQMMEIQRITDQAHIHQKLLEDLQSEPEGKAELKTSDSESILNQEKLRVISDETEKNRRYIEDLKKQESESA